MAKTKKTEKPVIKYSQHDRIFAALEILQDNCINSKGCTECAISIKTMESGELEAYCIFDLVGVTPDGWDIQPHSVTEPLTTDQTYNWL